MRNRTERYRLRPVLAEGEILIPPDMVREMQAAAHVNQNLEERFQVLTSKLYRAIADTDWDGAEKLKIKLNAISEILTDV
jgi:hypothetical protein